MRWNDLFSDLEGQLAAAHSAEFDSRVAELASAERASIGLASRLVAALGADLTLRLDGGAVVRGTLTDATPSWVLLQEGARERLVPIRAITAVEGLPLRSATVSDVERRLTLGHALRLLASQGAKVVVESNGSQFRGRITSVGADHCDILMEEDRGTVAVAFDRVQSVTSS